MVTNLPTYIVNGALSANIEGPAITMKRATQLKIRFVSTATNTPNGLLSLQGSDNGTDWEDVPNAASILPASGNLSAQTKICLWKGLNYDFVRLKWTLGTPGSGVGATINASARAQGND